MIKKIFTIIVTMIMTVIPMETLAEPIPLRGIVEGFYGTPWTHENRIDIFKFCNQHNLNAYIYAPKDDPYHRAKWRESYPNDKLKEIAELIQSAKQNNVKFIFAVSPGLDLNYSSEDDLQAMIKKLTAIYKLGARDFAIFFDDIEYKDGGAQAQFLNLIQERFIEKNKLPPLITVPTEYFRKDMIDELGRKPYTANFSMTLNQKMLVLYTGEGVVQPEITDEQYQSANEIYNRQLGIWWNYPVTDYMEAKLALGAIEGLPHRSKISAIFFNPMKYEQLSKIALSTGADYANNPEKYDSKTSWNKAIDEQFGNLSTEFKIFAEHSKHLENSWAKIGSTDGAKLRLMFDEYLNGKDNINELTEELKLIEMSIKKLQAQLPANILVECQPQLKQFERIIDADFTALQLLKHKRDNNVLMIKETKEILNKKLEQIKLYENSALISDKTARAFIDEVINY